MHVKQTLHRESFATPCVKEPAGRPTLAASHASSQVGKVSGSVRDPSREAFPGTCQPAPRAKNICVVIQVPIRGKTPRLRLCNIVVLVASIHRGRLSWCHSEPASSSQPQVPQEGQAPQGEAAQASRCCISIYQDKPGRRKFSSEDGWLPGSVSILYGILEAEPLAKRKRLHGPFVLALDDFLCTSSIC